MYNKYGFVVWNALIKPPFYPSRVAPWRGFVCIFDDMLHMCNIIVIYYRYLRCYYIDTRKGINKRQVLNMFNELSNKKAVEWSYDSTNNDWTSLDKWVEEGRPEKFIVLGVFINPHGKITKNEEGEVPYVITKGFNIRLPLWCVKMVKMLLDDPALVEGIDSGKCGAKVMQYEDQFGKTRNKIELYDIE